MAYYNTNTDAFLNALVRTADQPDRDMLATHTLMQTIGDPAGKTVIDLCCGDGRLGWKLLEMGAKSVIGVDISREMLKRAGARRKVLHPKMRDRIRFVQADLRKSTLKLPQADIVTGLYVLHHADTRQAIGGMGRFIARNLKADGTCAMVTLNPDIDPRADHTAAHAEEEVFIDFSDTPECLMRSGVFSCPIWRWTRDVLEQELTGAGLRGFDWQDCDLPFTRPDLRARYAAWIRDPQCVVFSARPAPVV